MSDTPRTDSIAHRAYHLDVLVGKAIDLCRELERENTALREALTFYGDCQTYGLNGGNIKRILTDAGASARHALRKEEQP
jgi:hypothetical protein